MHDADQEVDDWLRGKLYGVFGWRPFTSLLGPDSPHVTDGCLHLGVHISTLYVRHHAVVKISLILVLHDIFLPCSQKGTNRFQRMQPTSFTLSSITRNSATL